MPLSVIRHEDAGAFLDRVGGFLGRHEAENNLLFGILDGLRRDVSISDGPPLLAEVRDGDEILAVALRTPPRNLVVAECQAPAAIDALVDDLVAAGDTLPGALGPVDAIRRFVERWTALTGQPHRKQLGERAFRLSRVIPPPAPAGEMRLAGADDFRLLVDWLLAFSAEALPEEDNDPADAERLVQRWLEHGYRRNYLWEVDREAVSWAGAGGRTPHGTRIGPVYTPPEHRRRGYAGALVAEASQAELDEGLEFCFLFTDLANPTSNKIYQQIGYEPVADVDEYRFD
jgi:hypothetical protein